MVLGERYERMLTCDERMLKVVMFPLTGVCRLYRLAPRRPLLAEALLGECVDDRHLNGDVLGSGLGGDVVVVLYRALSRCF